MVLPHLLGYPLAKARSCGNEAAEAGPVKQDGVSSFWAPGPQLCSRLRPWLSPHELRVMESAAVDPDLALPAQSHSKPNIFGPQDWTLAIRSSMNQLLTIQ